MIRNNQLRSLRENVVILTMLFNNVLADCKAVPAALD